jgi:hypothetical protein
LARAATQPPARRFGPALAQTNFNIWPDILVRVAGDGEARAAHWARIGLDREELLFIVVLLRYYREHAHWPVLKVEDMAAMLGVSERQVRRLKSALVDDDYLGRIERANPRTKERWPDALDLRPLFALLEACAFLYHGDELAHSSQPAWQDSGPRRAPLDPDAFGQNRRKRRQQRQAATRAQGGRVIHSQGTWMSGWGRTPVTATGRTPASPVTEQLRLRTTNQNNRKQEPSLQSTLLPGWPLRGPMNQEMKMSPRARLKSKPTTTARPGTSMRGSLCTSSSTRQNCKTTTLPGRTSVPTSSGGIAGCRAGHSITP